MQACQSLGPLFDSGITHSSHSWKSLKKWQFLIIARKRYCVLIIVTCLMDCNCLITIFFTAGNEFLNYRTLLLIRFADSIL